MLDIVTAQIPGKCQIFFNISKNVGIGQPNDPLDVLLVQFGFSCAAKNPANPASPDVKAKFALVIPGSPYSGIPNDPLSRAIETLEKSSRSKVIDGHISRMRGSTPFYAGARGQEPYALSRLVNNIYDMTKDVWPRIDRDSSCPTLLGQAVKQLLQNT